MSKEKGKVKFGGPVVHYKIAKFKMANDGEVFKAGQKIEYYNREGDLTEGTVIASLSIQCSVENITGSMEYVWKRNIRSYKKK